MTFLAKRNLIIYWKPNDLYANVDINNIYAQANLLSFALS